MTHAAIQADGLGKRYRVGEREYYRALRDLVGRAYSASTRLFVRSTNGAGRNPSSFMWALRNVSFQVPEGEVVGLIGRNGAGKSTLLKILARITKPTEGEARIRGRIGSLLEVGTGFHPELTGRENVYLSGAILGMRKSEINRKFDEIVAFSEVERFLDTPLKFYSSGMQMRLAFAVAAHLEPEILLVDEVLAVGDTAFQRKCLGKMGEVARQGRTIVFVSHNLGAITRLCSRSIWLDAGQIRMDGGSGPVVSAYQLEGFAHRAQWIRPDSMKTNPDCAFTSVAVKSPEGEYSGFFNGDQPVAIAIEYFVRRPLSGCQIGVRVLNSEGVVIFSTSDADHLGVSAVSKEQGSYEAVFEIPAGFLAPGSYSLILAAHLPYRQMYDFVEQSVAFEIGAPGSLASLDGRLGVVTPLLRWETKALRDPVAK
jgi:lipopolysaccharide transport system ATP-binding protein